MEKLIFALFVSLNSGCALFQRPDKQFVESMDVHQRAIASWAYRELDVMVKQGRLDPDLAELHSATITSMREIIWAEMDAIDE